MLAVSATLRATRTVGKRSPRMVKRRNSRYKPHDWNAPTRVPIDCAPRALPPMPREPRSRAIDQHHWSPEHPGGTFTA